MTGTEESTPAPLWPAPMATGPVDAVVAVPGSKSASNRALVLAALAEGESTIRGLLDARDTQLMMAALRLLGNEVHVVEHDDSGNVTVQVVPHFMRGPVAIDVGLAGTVMRFVPPLAALAHGEITFDGDAHARRRPMVTVIESLKDLGVRVHDRGTGRLPFMLEATGEVTGGEVFVDASKSSQFVSGLLLSAARFNAGVTIHHVGDPIPSMPHIAMTIAMLAEHGVPVRWDDTTVFLGLPRPGSAELEIQMIRTVRVEGYQEGDVVVARVVRDVSAGAGRRDGDRFRRVPGAQDKPQPWVAYQQRLR